ncbi:hypothetical protein Plhal304r1_c003g0009391 [Plasmopara halstedii]
MVLTLNKLIDALTPLTAGAHPRDPYSRGNLADLGLWLKLRLLLNSWLTTAPIVRASFDCDFANTKGAGSISKLTK